MATDPESEALQQASGEATDPDNSLDSEPAILRHCKRFYAKLDDLATVADIKGGPSGTTKVRVYSGKITAVLAELDPPLQLPYYTRMRQLLLDMGCMTQLERGSRSQPSKWALHYPPTVDLFTHVNPDEASNKHTREQLQIYQSVVDQQMRDMRRTITSMQNDVDALNIAVAQLLAEPKAAFVIPTQDDNKEGAN